MNKSIVAKDDRIIIINSYNPENSSFVKSLNVPINVVLSNLY